MAVARCQRTHEELGFALSDPSHAWSLSEFTDGLDFDSHRNSPESPLRTVNVAAHARVVVLNRLSCSQ